MSWERNILDKMHLKRFMFIYLHFPSVSHTILFQSEIKFYAVLNYTNLNYTVLHCTVLYCTVLLYVIMYMYVPTLQWEAATTLLQKCLLAPTTIDATRGHWYVPSAASALIPYLPLPSFNFSLYNSFLLFSSLLFILLYSLSLSLSVSLFLFSSLSLAFYLVFVYSLPLHIYSIPIKSFPLQLKLLMSYIHQLSCS